jgi:hypothetical protein
MKPQSLPRTGYGESRLGPLLVLSEHRGPFPLGQLFHTLGQRTVNAFGGHRAPAVGANLEHRYIYIHPLAQGSLCHGYILT